jgi:flagellar FliJ protein
MPPKFSLQSILDYHHSRVETIEVELGQILAVRQQLVDAIADLTQRQGELMNELAEMQSGEIDLQAIIQARYMIKTIQNKLIELRNQLQLIEQAIMDKRQELIQARQDEKVYDNLKDKELERYAEKQREAEKRMQDDIYISRAHASSSGSSN